MKRLRSVRVRFNLHNYVNIHHVLPKQHRHMIPRGMLNEKNNLMLLPTKKGMENMNLRKSRLVHQGGHIPYNQYVGELLRDIIATHATQALLCAAIIALQTELKRRIRADDQTLPWN